MFRRISLLCLLVACVSWSSVALAASELYKINSPEWQTLKIINLDVIGYINTEDFSINTQDGKIIGKCVLLTEICKDYKQEMIYKERVEIKMNPTEPFNMTYRYISTWLKVKAGEETKTDYPTTWSVVNPGTLQNILYTEAMLFLMANSD